jgi:DNA-binding response OmpR family regulator
MRIVIFEDSQTLISIMAGACKSYGHVVTSYSGKELHNKFYTSAELYLINTRLENATALNLVETIKKNSEDAHIIAINSKGSWKDTVDFVRVGISTVMNYPFPIQELLERINTLETTKINKVYTEMEIGNIRLKPHLKEVFLHDKPLNLRRKEYSLLTYLAKNSQRPVSRSELLDNVWDYRQINNSNTVDVHIRRLREKLGDEKAIKTVYGYGYRLSDAKSTQ